MKLKLFKRLSKKRRNRKSADKDRKPKEQLPVECRQCEELAAKVEALSACLQLLYERLHHYDSERALNIALAQRAKANFEAEVIRYKCINESLKEEQESYISKLETCLLKLQINQAATKSSADNTTNSWRLNNTVGGAAFKLNEPDSTHVKYVNSQSATQKKPEQETKLSHPLSYHIGESPFKIYTKEYGTRYDDEVTADDQEVEAILTDVAPAGEYVRQLYGKPEYQLL